MWLFPSENFYIISKLTPGEVANKLKETIYVPNGAQYIENYDAYSVKYFIGYANNNGFKVKPDITYRNTFLPEITGSCESFNQGSKIHIKIKIMPLGLMALYFFISILLLATVVMMVIHDLNKSPFGLADLIPMIMCLFIYCLALFSFKYESRKAINTLLYVFEGS